MDQWDYGTGPWNEYYEAHLERMFWVSGMGIDPSNVQSYAGGILHHLLHQCFALPILCTLKLSEIEE